jgi:hypothetical protein
LRVAFYFKRDAVVTVDIGSHGVIAGKTYLILRSLFAATNPFWDVCAAQRLAPARDGSGALAWVI